MWKENGPDSENKIPKRLQWEKIEKKNMECEPFHQNLVLFLLYDSTTTIMAFYDTTTTSVKCNMS